MGNKGVMKRKPPKEKIKPLAPDHPEGGGVSSLNHSDSVLRKSPGGAKTMPFGNGGMTPSSKSQHRLKNHK
jgi:hypothetical protein